LLKKFLPLNILLWLRFFFMSKSRHRVCFTLFSCLFLLSLLYLLHIACKMQVYFTSALWSIRCTRAFTWSSEIHSVLNQQRDCHLLGSPSFLTYHYFLSVWLTGPWLLFHLWPLSLRLRFWIYLFRFTDMGIWDLQQALLAIHSWYCNSNETFWRLMVKSHSYQHYLLSVNGKLMDGIYNSRNILLVTTKT
jgi:hypothetical protein